MKDEAIAELILWAFNNREEAKRTYPVSIRVQSTLFGYLYAYYYVMLFGYQGLPVRGGVQVALWREKCAFYKAIEEAGPPPTLSFFPPSNNRKPLSLKRRKVIAGSLAASLSRLKRSLQNPSGSNAVLHTGKDTKSIIINQRVKKLL